MPPRKKGNTGLVIGLVIGGVVLLLGAGTVAAIFFLGAESTDEPSQAAPHFSGEYEAHESICGSLKLTTYAAAVGEFDNTQDRFTELNKYTEARVSCNYEIPADAGEENFFIAISARVFTDASGAEDRYRTITAGDALENQTDANGWGDQAVWASKGKTDKPAYVDLVVQDSNLFMQISFIPGRALSLSSAKTILTDAGEEVMNELEG